MNPPLLGRYIGLLHYKCTIYLRFGLLLKQSVSCGLGHRQTEKPQMGRRRMRRPIWGYSVRLEEFHQNLLYHMMLLFSSGFCYVINSVMTTCVITPLWEYVTALTISHKARLMNFV